MSRTKHILIVDDEPDIRELVGEILEDEGFSVVLAEDAASARQQLHKQAFDLMLLDIWMPSEDGLAFLSTLTEDGQNLPCDVVVMSGHGTLQTAVEAVKLGAYDFIEKPISTDRLLIVLQRALEAGQLRHQLKQAQQNMLLDLVVQGESDAVTQLNTLMNRLANLDAPVLLQGDAGVGKAAVARLLHQASTRHIKPFVEVFGSALTEDMGAHSLFGQEHNGQVTHGLMEQAHGGTLFINEVTELPIELQQQLAHVLERRAFLRLGGSHPVSTDVRVLAACSDSPDQARADGSLCDELYFSLASMPLPVPNLAERAQDVPFMVRALIDFHAERDGLPGRRFPDVVLKAMSAYSWPGNLRELRTVVQRLLLLGVGEVSESELTPLLVGKSNDHTSGSWGVPMDAPLREAREQFEKHYLSARLLEAGGSVSKLAKLSGVERTHLYRKLRDLGIELPGQKSD